MSLCDFGDTLFIYTKGTSHGAAREGENSQSVFLTLQINDRLTPQAASVISLMQQLKGQQTCRTASPVGEIDRLGSVRNLCFYRILFPHIRVLNWNRRQRFSIPFCLDFKYAIGIATDFNLDSRHIFTGKIFESRRGRVLHIGDISWLFITISSILHNLWKFISPHIDRRSIRKQMTGYVSRIFSFIRQRTTIQATGRNLHLGNASIRQNADLLGASLPAVPAAVGVAVIKYVPFSTMLP